MASFPLLILKSASFKAAGCSCVEHFSKVLSIFNFGTLQAKFSHITEDIEITPNISASLLEDDKKNPSSQESKEGDRILSMFLKSGEAPCYWTQLGDDITRVVEDLDTLSNGKISSCALINVRDE